MKARINKTVTTSASVSDVFKFLADFTSTEIWDPGTVSTKLVSGDGRTGSTYANTSRFLGKETELTYVVTEFEADRRITLRGENKTVTATDTITVEADPNGSTKVSYDAEFKMKGLAKLALPFLLPAFAKLGNEGADKMERTLQDLGPTA